MLVQSVLVTASASSEVALTMAISHQPALTVQCFSDLVACVNSIGLLAPAFHTPYHKYVNVLVARLQTARWLHCDKCHS